MYDIDMARVREVLTAELDKPGQTARGLALRAGLGPDAVRDILRGKSNTAQLDTLTALAKAIGGDLSLFASAAPERPPEVQDVGAAFRPMPVPNDPRSWPRDVPVLGSALGGEMKTETGEEIEQTALETLDIVDMVRRPPTQFNNQRLYALYVVGTSMEPRHDAGDLIYVDPRRPPAIGDDVVVQLRDGNGHDGSERVVCALIKRLLKRTALGVELEQFNPPARFFVNKRDIAAMHRVLRTAELTGV